MNRALHILRFGDINAAVTAFFFISLKPFSTVYFRIYQYGIKLLKAIITHPSEETSI